MLTPMLAQILISLAVTYLGLYLAGNEYTAITGGWMSQAWAGASGWDATLPGLTKQSSRMLVTLNSVVPDVYTYSGAIRVTDLIDLTAIAKIRITLSANLSGPKIDGFGGQQIYLIASSGYSGDWPFGAPSSAGVLANIHSHTSYGTQQIPPSETLTNVQYELDVSGLPDGSYYVSVGFMWYKQYATSNVSIEAVEMLAG